MRQARHRGRSKDTGASSFVAMLCASSLLGRPPGKRQGELVLRLLTTAWLLLAVLFAISLHWQIVWLIGKRVVFVEWGYLAVASQPVYHPNYLKYNPPGLVFHPLAEAYRRHFTYRRILRLPMWVKGFNFVLLPLYIPILVTTISLVVGIWRSRKSRGAAGHCPGCRYDLTGNSSGVCPECGENVREQQFWAPGP